MFNLQVWEWLLLGAGVYIAWTSLARLMRNRREELLGVLTAEAQAEQERRQLAEMRERRKKKKKQAQAANSPPLAAKKAA